MTRLAPEFTPNSADLIIGETTVRNCWLIPGDTPKFIRVYTDPFNVGKHQDVDPSIQCWGWSNLRKGTLLQFDVCCVYPDGEEKCNSFPAKTTDTQDPPAQTPPTFPLIADLQAVVQPFLRGVNVTFMNSDQLDSVSIDIEAPGIPRHWVSDQRIDRSPGGHTAVIPGKALKYSTSYTGWLVAHSNGARADYPFKFAIDHDPRFTKTPNDHEVHIGDAKNRKHSLDGADLGPPKAHKFDEGDIEGPHTHVSP